ncbi:hypothetical protein [Sphingobacterium pedocola]|uniref:Uncharacterized protein n=1 Tax=Sphingobacterium pedocola TaxID=2082722 RepID=A0ABR9T3N2_9SPHI|nr:hypothetical protein [Sphingobacterium pedocola]MBE8719957.1 hypothetical protein [Sphingobacterium pedocola]
MNNTRICIYPKDVSIILGKSLSQARRILSLIKEVYGKADHQYLSIQEFADYTGLDPDEIKKMCRS